MAAAPPLSVPLSELIAARFQVLADPMRIRLLDRLREGEATGQRLAAELGSSQQNVSRHLGLLHQAGVLRRRRQGPFVHYAIGDESVLELCELVCGGLERRLAELGGALAGGAPGGRGGGRGLA